MFDYEIKLAETEKEKEEAFKLRFKVFREELGSNPATLPAEETETDDYDNYCDHLIVIDKMKNSVVGTYRLLLGSKVNPQVGFYSEKIFEIPFIKSLGEEKLELSRSCVHYDYRENLVINLLWSGIARYIRENQVRYLFGSVRLNTQDTEEVSKIYSFIKQRHYATEEFKVHPRRECVFKGLKDNLEFDYKKTFFKLPPLVKGYLRLGVEVCGPPAWNPDFNSVVIFILLDMQKVPHSYRRHFLGI